MSKIQSVVDAIKGFDASEQNSKNKNFVVNVVKKNVQMTVADIRKNSSVLSELEKFGDIKIVGALYDLNTGKVSLVK